MIINQACYVCEKQVEGTVCLFDDTDKDENKGRVITGHICHGCSIVACYECSSKAFNHGAWHGYDKSYCKKCGRQDSEPPFIVGRMLEEVKAEKKLKGQEQSQDHNSEANGSVSEQSPASFFVGAAATIVFMTFASDAPFSEGGPAVIRWTVDGGYIYWVGAAILGFVVSKTLGQRRRD